MDGESIKEVAKATHKALEVSENVGKFFNACLGDSFQELGGCLSDRVKYYRYKNLLKIIDKVEQLNHERRMRGKVVPMNPSIGIPLLDSASLAEDDNLQQKWATLIFNATDPNCKDKIRKSYVAILSSMDPMDALILDWIVAPSSDTHLGVTNIRKIARGLDITETDAKLSTSNLNRLGLIDFDVSTTMNSISISIFKRVETTFSLSLLGLEFLKLCKFDINIEKPSTINNGTMVRDALEKIEKHAIFEGDILSGGTA